MTPPFVPRALVAAATSPADYAIVAGDLEEEYTLLRQSTGRSCADRWYWSQALRSIPSLLSYSRSRRSAIASGGTLAIVLGVLVAMLAAKDLIDRVIDIIAPGGVSIWLYFPLDWIDAAVFGAVLAHFARHPVRLAFFASTFLVAAFGAPVILGLSPALGSAAAGILLLGTVPAMSIGAAAYQIARRRNVDN